MLILIFARISKIATFVFHALKNENVRRLPSPLHKNDVGLRALDLATSGASVQ